MEDAYVKPVLSDGAFVQLWAATEDVKAKCAGALHTDWEWGFHTQNHEGSSSCCSVLARFERFLKNINWEIKIQSFKAIRLHYKLVYPININS